MKCQILFHGRNKKNISKCGLLKILPRVLSVRQHLLVIHLIQCTIIHSTVDNMSDCGPGVASSNPSSAA